MKKLFVVLPLLFIISTACGDETYTEKETTEHEVCVYDRTYDFWGNQQTEKLVGCFTKEEHK